MTARELFFWSLLLFGTVVSSLNKTIEDSHGRLNGTHAVSLTSASRCAHKWQNQPATASVCTWHCKADLCVCSLQTQMCRGTQDLKLMMLLCGEG